MFKLNVMVLASVFSMLPSFLFAAESKPEATDSPDMIIIVSTVRNLSAMAIGDDILYTKTFDIIIHNSSEAPLDLTKGCFQAVMPDKTVLRPDTIDKSLFKGILKAGEQRKGFVAFSTADESVYKASAVKYLPVCD